MVVGRTSPLFPLRSFPTNVHLRSFCRWSNNCDESFARICGLHLAIQNRRQLLPALNGKLCPSCKNPPIAFESTLRKAKAFPTTIVEPSHVRLECVQLDNVGVVPYSCCRSRTPCHFQVLFGLSWHHSEAHRRYSGVFGQRLEVQPLHPTCSWFGPWFFQRNSHCCLCSIYSCFGCPIRRRSSNSSNRGWLAGSLVFILF